MRPRKALLAALAAAALVAVGCGSSTSGKSSANAPTGASGGSGQTYTLGVLTDLTGPIASAGRTTPLGIKAGVGLVNSEGYNIKYVVADTGSSPAGALAGAQKLVLQDHVFAVLALSGLTFAAAPFLTSHGIPVVGSANDSTEWIGSRNMFSVFGTEDYTKVASTFGTFFKNIGVTNLASLGYSISPSSSEAAKGAAISAQQAGVKVGYLNANLPFGTTNVGPVVLAMKNAGVNGFVAAIDENAAFLILSAMHQQGVNLKAPLLSVGYGADLTSAGPGAEQAAQGAYFTLSFEPVEMHTAATERFQKAMQQYAGVSGDPSLSEYIAYVAVDGFVTGLKAAGSHPTQAQFINTMLGIRQYNAAGLFGSHSIGFGMNQRGQAAGADNCVWVAQYSGTTFHLVSGADPVCGTILPGQRVSSSS
jgi:branched-chain amino acid transport system substrate-binding protein